MSIAVDLDGTLAHYDGWRGIQHIGDPIPSMMNRVRGWIAAGEEVVIFTARITPHPVYSPGKDTEEAIQRVRDWCIRWGLPADIRITNIKDGGMKEFWDDRAIPVLRNSGVIGLHPYKLD